MILNMKLILQPLHVMLNWDKVIKTLGDCTKREVLVILLNVKCSPHWCSTNFWVSCQQSFVRKELRWNHQGSQARRPENGEWDDTSSNQVSKDFITLIIIITNLFWNRGLLWLFAHRQFEEGILWQSYRSIFILSLSREWPGWHRSGTDLQDKPSESSACGNLKRPKPLEGSPTASLIDWTQKGESGYSGPLWDKETR